MVVQGKSKELILKFTFANTNKSFIHALYPNQAVTAPVVTASPAQAAYTYSGTTTSKLRNQNSSSLKLFIACRQ